MDTLGRTRLAAQPVALEVLRSQFCQGQEHSRDAVLERVADALADPESARAACSRDFLEVLRCSVCNPELYRANLLAPATLAGEFAQPLASPTSFVPASGKALEELRERVAPLLAAGARIAYDFSAAPPLPRPPQRAEITLSSLLATVEAWGRSSAPQAKLTQQQSVLLPFDHPDIEEILQMLGDGFFAGLQFAFAVTDEFIQTVRKDEFVALTHSALTPAQGASAAAPPRQVRARSLWERLLSVQRLRLVARRTGTRFPLELRATTELISADAGLVFPQRLNRYPPFVGFTNARSVFVPGAGTVLPPGAGVCSLDLDLTQFVQAPFTHEADFDLRGFAAVVRNAVHLLDNAIDLSAWPSPECGAVMQQHRPIRLGLTGLGDALIMLRLVYGSAPAMMQAATIASTLCTESHRASAFLARKRGACAVFSVSETEEDWSLEKCYRHSAFASGLPAEVRKQIESHGLRHSRLLGIGAPNVSSLAFADGVSAGLDPVLRWERCYTPTDPAGEAPEPFCDYAWRYLQHCDPQLGVPQRPDFLLRAAVDPREHAKQVASVRRYLDGGLTLAGLTGEESLPQFLELAERQWSETKL